MPREAEALAAARLVCPELAPERATTQLRLLDDEWVSAIKQAQPFWTDEVWPAPANDFAHPAHNPQFNEMFPAKYEVSCEKIKEISITYYKDIYLPVKTKRGHLYFLSLDLKTEAALDYLKTLWGSPKVGKRIGDQYSYDHFLVITANGKPIRNDIPELSSFMSNRISLPMLREEDAFAAARAVCPELVPDKVVNDWPQE